MYVLEQGTTCAGSSCPPAPSTSFLPLPGQSVEAEAGFAVL